MILDNYNFKSFFDSIRDKNITITGGTGSLGFALLKRIFGTDFKGKIIILSRNESKQVEIRECFNSYRTQLEFVVGDVRDRYACTKAMKGSDIIIHAAGFKHVPAGELAPMEVVKSNIIGSLNIIEVAQKMKNDLKLICISTDKVSNPRNIYGMSKNIMSRMFTEADRILPQTFFTARYGNVLGSAGSVVPIWDRAIKEKRSTISITSKAMTRFCFLMEEACRLVFWCLENCKGGEEVGAKMPAFNLIDLAEVMVKDTNTKIEVVGLRLGEKLDEELFSVDELNKSVVSNDLIVYKFDQIAGNKFDRGFTSDQAVRLTKEELGTILFEEGWMPEIK